MPRGGLAKRGLNLTGDMVPVEHLVLTARIKHCPPSPQSDSVPRGGPAIQPGGGLFVASVDGLDVQGEGETADVARDELVQAMISWISAMDCADSMAVALAEAGFPEIDEETELHLEFADSQAETVVD